MSSTLRSYAQVAPRESFLLTTSASTMLYTTTMMSSVINLSTVSPAETNADLSQNVTLNVNVLLRDMGRSVTLYANNAAGRAVKVAVFREVQLINGDHTEGVSDIRRLVVPVWVDNAAAEAPFTPVPTVQVARCG